MNRKKQQKEEGGNVFFGESGLVPDETASLQIPHERRSHSASGGVIIPQ